MSDFQDVHLTLSPATPGEMDWEITGLMPCQYSFKVRISRARKKEYMPAETFKCCVDSDTGEVLENPLAFFRKCWANKIIDEFGGLPLYAAIDALPIDGLGPTTARALADKLGSWNNFVEAMVQLRSFDLPESRDDLWLMLSGELDNAVVIGFGTPELPPKPPRPLLDVFETGGIGLQTLKKMKTWAETTSFESDIAGTEMLGTILSAPCR